MGRESVSGPLLSPEVLSANGAVVAAARGQLEEGALDGYAARGAGQRSRRGSLQTPAVAISSLLFTVRGTLLPAECTPCCLRPSLANDATYPRQRPHRRRNGERPS